MVVHMRVIGEEKERRKMKRGKEESQCSTVIPTNYESCPSAEATVRVDHRVPNLEKNPPVSFDVELPARERKDHAGDTGRCMSMAFGSRSWSRPRDDARFCIGGGGWFGWS